MAAAEEVRMKVKGDRVRQTMSIQKVEHLVGDVKILSFIGVLLYILYIYIYVYYICHWRILSRGGT